MEPTGTPNTPNPDPNAQPAPQAPAAPQGPDLNSLTSRLDAIMQRQERQDQALAALIARAAAPSPAPANDPYEGADPEVTRAIEQRVAAQLQPLAQRVQQLTVAAGQQAGEALLQRVGATPEEIAQVHANYQQLLTSGYRIQDRDGTLHVPSLEFAAVQTLGLARIQKAQQAPAVRAAVNSSAVVESSARAAAPAVAPSIKTPRNGRLTREQREALAEKLDEHLTAGGQDFFG